MELFTVDELVVYPSKDALLIPAFAELVKRSLKELAYVYFTVSPKMSNPFHLHSKEQKHKSLCEKVMQDPDYQPDELVEKCIFIYQDLLKRASPSLLLLDSALSAIHKTNQFYQNLDYNEKDRSGKTVHKPKEVLQSIQEIEATSANLTKLKERVNKELEESTKKQAALPTEDPLYLETVISQWEEAKQTDQTNQTISYDQEIKSTETAKAELNEQESDSDSWFDLQDDV